MIYPKNFLDEDPTIQYLLLYTIRPLRLIGSRAYADIPAAVDGKLSSVEFPEIAVVQRYFSQALNI